jgi:hypothetical protein
MTISKKVHPADAADLALIPACKKFTATILKGGKPQTSEFDSLTSARLEAVKLDATSNNGRKALVYAITAEGKSILVPALYGRTPADAGSAAAKADDKARDAKAGKPISGKPSEADLAAAKEEAAERAALKAKQAKPEKAAKPAKKAKAAKPAKAAKAKPAKKAKPEGKSKVDIVIKMLTGAKAVTRKDIAEAVAWPSINIKAICARKGMKLKQEKDGTLSATAPKA